MDAEQKKGSGTLSTKKKAVISILTAAAVLLAVFAGNELYKTGYEAGLYEGHSGWYDKGYEEGSQDGYERGFEEGAAYVKAFLSTEKKPEKADEHEETLLAEENMPDDNPPIGIILSREKDELLVEYATYGMDSNLFVSKYELYLPNRDDLKRLVDRIIEEDVQHE